MKLHEVAEAAYRERFHAWLSLPFEIRETGRAEIERLHAIWGRAMNRHFDRERAALATR